MLANFVAMLLYYRIYNMLIEKDMLSRYSPANIIMHLSRIYKLKIDDRWMLSEVPKTSRNVTGNWDSRHLFPKNCTVRVESINGPGAAQ